MEGALDREFTYQRMVESLQNGRLAWEDVCMVIVKLSAGKNTANVIWE